MTRRAYIKKRFSPDNQELLQHCLDAIRSPDYRGLRLSLRQLYYVLVSRDLLPNEDKSYKRLGKIISDARLAGLLDWSAIEDRNRTPITPAEFDSLRDLIEAAVRSYRLPRLKGQTTYVELWVEKAALANVLAPLAREYHATLMVNRGYSSSSAMMESAERIDQKCRHWQGRNEGSLCVDEAVILYLGDLDPSGEDMVRDIQARLAMFLSGGEREGDYGACESPTGWNLYAVDPVPLRVEKIALTMEQVEEYDPPPNPAKKTDSRAKGYIEKYGKSSWEVDALPPPVLQQIIRNAFEEYVDLQIMEEIKQQERADIMRLRALTVEES